MAQPRSTTLSEQEVSALMEHTNSLKRRTPGGTYVHPPKNMSVLEMVKALQKEKEEKLAQLAAMGETETHNADGSRKEKPKRKAHCKRKHCKDCPKHLLHLKQQGKELPEVTEEERAKCVPNTIGKGFAMFISGNYHDQKWERRPNREHPDFRQVAKVADVTKHDDQGRLGPTPDFHTRPNSTGVVPLVMDPVNKLASRRKYDMKDYLERLYSMGTALLRDF